MPKDVNERLRTLRAADIPTAFELSAQAGWNQTEEDWSLLLELCPDSCLGIEVEGQLVATTTLFCYGRRLAWIGMVLTRSEYRRHGLAKKLLTYCLEQADRMGIETTKLDATDQGQPLYEKFGFHPEQEIQRWSRAGEGAAPMAVSDVSVGEPWRALDSLAFGADRSILLRRLAQRHPPISISESYLFSRAGRMTAYLGPCVGENLETARRLIEECVQSTKCSWSWDLFPRNQEAVALARDLGFSPQRHLVRMARGKELREQENAIYAIAGFELG
ncbi:MAG TPA: GNAT family N-acetyltransferase [Candidatus Sulfotelmatobacter sp.]|jgi:GNAT superfamily N-acetyltransferase|nr:GNAT family N-acetyltransferase [Candidatus Sulfotelmatobacter sp.]